MGLSEDRNILRNFAAASPGSLVRNYGWDSRRGFRRGDLGSNQSPVVISISAPYAPLMPHPAGTASL